MKTLTSTLLTAVAFVATFSASAANLVKPESVDMKALKLEVQKNLQVEKQNINALIEVNLHQQSKNIALLENEQRINNIEQEAKAILALAD